jgi:TP901 family phage tail tape measure protein
MPASVRDILLVIKTKEDAQKALHGISAAMRRTQAQADAASARARAAALRSQATQARLNGASKAQVTALQAAARAQDQQARSIEQAQKKAGHFATSVERVGSLAQSTGLALIGMGAAATYGMKQAIDTAVAWDKQVRLTFTQVDKRYKPSLKELSDIGVRVANDIAIPFEQVQTALFDVFSSTEANMPQAEQLLRSFAKAAVAGNTDVQTASRATIGIMNAFKIPFKDVNDILDIQFQLVQEGVGTYEEWAQRIGLVTPSAVRAGQSVEGMAAALATSTRMGISAARSGTAVARAFDAMSNPKVEKKLKEIGVASRDAQGNMRPLVDIMTDWKKALDKLPKEDRVGAILETLKSAGSTIEARRFLQGILLTKGGLELFQDQVKEFAKDKGAFQKAYKEMADSVAAKTQKLKNAWSTLKLTLGNALMPSFSKLLDNIQKLVDWFNKLPPGTQATIAKFAAFAGIAAIVLGVVLLIVGGFIAFAAAIAVAGTAILPVSAALLGIGAAIGLAILGFAALVAGLIIAYQKSKNFRDLVGEIKTTISNLIGVIKGFATTLYNNFTQNVLPPLKRLRDTINNDVLPAAKNFVTWWNTNMIPMLKRGGEIVNNQLKPAFKSIGDTIDNTIIPAVKDLTKWWKENENTIKPVIKFMGMFVITGMVMVGFITGLLIKSLMMGVRNIRLLGMALYQMVVGPWKLMYLQASQTIGVLKRVWQWFKDLGKGAKSGANAARNAMIGLKNSILGLFAGAAGWLRSAGANIVRGLIGGISGSIGGVRQAAAGVAQAAVSAAKAALKVKSPSRVFKDIGKDVVRGFILGVKDATTMKQLQNAMYKISRDVIRSINAADIKKSAKDKMRDKWNKRLAKTSKQLTALENKRLAVQKKLTAAQKSLNDQIKVRNELSTKIRDAVRASADISSLDDEQKTSGENIKKGLQDRLKEVQAFYTNLRNLSKLGFDKTSIAEIAAMGVESGGALANTLANSSYDDLQAISKLQQQIRNLATTTGTHVAGDLYNAGIAAAQGLVKGLNSQMKSITAAMTKIANALVKAIKKELGIKSPSTVFADLGINTAQGYINGYMQRMNQNMDTLQQATAFQPTGPGLRRTVNSANGAYAGTTTVRHYDQKITVNTHEIDPRKTAAELGWELEGRLP